MENDLCSLLSEAKFDENKMVQALDLFTPLINKFAEKLFFMDKEDAANAEDEWIKKYADDGWIMINKKPGGDLGYGPQKYTKEFCAEEAKKYEYRKDFKRDNNILYNYASRHRWLEDICFHMPKRIPSKRYWTKKRCIKEARKHKTFSQFRKNCASAYAIAWRNGWLDEIHEIFGNKERKGRKV